MKIQRKSGGLKNLFKIRPGDDDCPRTPGKKSDPNRCNNCFFKCELEYEDNENHLEYPWNIMYPKIECIYPEDK